MNKLGVDSETLMPNYSLKTIRETEMLTCFPCPVQFSYPRSLEGLHDIIEDLKIFELVRTSKRMRNLAGRMTLILACSLFSERKKIGISSLLWTICSDIADHSHAFASFLTVTTKFRYNFIYNF